MPQEINGVKIYLPSEAVDYLAERGVHYKVASLRNLRRRRKASANIVIANNSLWTEEELDAIVEYNKKKKGNDGGEERESHRCNFEPHTQKRHNHTPLPALIGAR